MTYGPERNRIEGKNGEAKNSLLAGLEEPVDRRQFVMAKQPIAILARTTTTNVHSLLRFLAKAQPPAQSPGHTPLSPYGHAWRSSKDPDRSPYRITGRRMADLIDEPPVDPTAVPTIPQVA